MTLPCSAVPRSGGTGGTEIWWPQPGAEGAGAGVEPDCPTQGPPEAAGNRDLCLGGGISERWDNLAPAPGPGGRAKRALERDRC